LGNKILPLHPREVTAINTELYTFKFFIKQIDEMDGPINEKIALIETTAFFNKAPVFEGVIRAKFNDHGIFPNAQDLAAAEIPLSVKRKMAAEIKRYIRPQKSFL
jgi:hypothetical protein